MQCQRILRIFQLLWILYLSRGFRTTAAILYCSACHLSSHPSSVSWSGSWPWGCSPSRRPWSRGWSTPSGCWPWRATPRHHSPGPTSGPWRRAGSPHWAWPSGPLAIAEDTLYVLWAEGSHNTFNGWHHQLDCRSKSGVHPGPTGTSRWRRWRPLWSLWSWWGRPTRWHHYHISTHPSSFSSSRACQRPLHTSELPPCPLLCKGTASFLPLA